MAKSIFRILSFDEFADYIQNTAFQRRILNVQNHHTWKPDYKDFKNDNHMVMLEGMRRDHINSRGWSDIGQNITIFPDGKIAVCRPIDIKPAGIFGANQGAICIESVGNFNTRGDVITNEQEQAIINTNAILCIKFGLSTTTSQVVYHHWFDRKGVRFSEETINSGKVVREDLQKTCPGTNFFNGTDKSYAGNTIISAQNNFYPKISSAMAHLQQQPVTQVQPVQKTITVSTLNVRAGNGIQFKIVRQLPKNMQVGVYQSSNGWDKISNSSEEWVSSKYLV